MLTSRTLRLTGITAALALSTALAACGTIPAGSTTNTGSQKPSAPATSAAQPTSPDSPAASAPAEPDPVGLSANVKDGAKNVKVDTLVKVSADGGTVSKVKLSYAGVDAKGVKFKGTVAGKLAKNKASWTAGDRLEPSATYRLAVTGANREGTKTTTQSSFKTASLALSQQTFPQMYPLKGMKVGIGMPVVINFDVAVKDKAAIEKNLKVVSSPSQAGSWRWFSDTEVRYRPAKYWKPGTKVTAYANVNGVNAGNGIYGQKSAKTSFTVGRSMKIRVNLASDVAKVYRNGKVVRTIYVSGGKPGWQTRSGVKLIMAKEWNKTMTNEMIGAEEDYSLTAAYALRITNSGEFLHSAPWNTGNFGRRNASHGCVGMSVGDSGWLIENTLIGDPVITTGSSRGMEIGNGYGDWNVSYQQYKKGSAV